MRRVLPLLVFIFGFLPQAWGVPTFLKDFTEANELVVQTLVDVRMGRISTREAKELIDYFTSDLKSHTNKTFLVKSLANQGQALIDGQFKSYLIIKRHVAAINEKANYDMDPELLKSVRAFGVLTQSVSDIASEALRGLGIGYKGPYHPKASELDLGKINKNLEVLVNPRYRNQMEFRSGDVLLVRSGAGFGTGISSVIANLTDVEGNFSHVGLVHVDEKGKKWVIEMDAARKLDKVPLEKFMSKKLARLAVFRLPNKDWAQRAGDAAGKYHADYKSGKLKVIYDLVGKAGNNSVDKDGTPVHRVNCVETLRYWIKIGSNGEISNFPAAKSSFSSVGPVLKPFGFDASQVRETPGDVLLGILNLAFYARNPLLTRLNRYMDAVINIYFHNSLNGRITFDKLKRYDIPAALIFKLGKKLNKLPEGFTAPLISLWLRLEVLNLMVIAKLTEIEQTLIGNIDNRNKLQRIVGELYVRMYNLAMKALNKPSNKGKRKLKDVIALDLKGANEALLLSRADAKSKIDKISRALRIRAIRAKNTPSLPRRALKCVISISKTNVHAHL